MQTCVFGPKDDFPDNAYATRTCMDHEVWLLYDSTECLSKQTYLLRQLLNKVSVSFLQSLYFSM